MRSGDATPEELARMFPLLCIFGYADWPDDESRSKALLYIRIEDERIRRAIESAKESIRLQHRRKAGKGAVGG